MKKTKLRFVRILSVSVIIVAIVVCMVIPASATPIDYEDYVTSSVTIEDTDIITVEFPVDMAGWQTRFVNRDFTPAKETDWYNVISGSAYYDGCPYSSSQVNWMQVRCYPFGLDNVTDNDELGIDNIPHGTKMTFNFSFTCAPQELGSYFGGLRYYINGKLDSTKDDITEFTNPTGDGVSSQIGSFNQEFTFVLDKNGGNYTSVRPLFEFHLFNCENYVSFVLKSITMELSISSVYNHYLQTGKTNKLLEAVMDKLEEQGTTIEKFVEEQQDTNDKLDQIINGTVSPEKPSGSGSIDNLEDVEGNLLGGVTDNFGEAGNVLGGATQIISRYGSAFLAVSYLFGMFINIPFINDIIMISFALGIFSTLLGVGLGAISSHNKKVEKAKRNKGG